MLPVAVLAKLILKQSDLILALHGVFNVPTVDLDGDVTAVRVNGWRRVWEQRIT